MLYLDCHNLDTALASFAAACHRPVVAVTEAILSYAADWTGFEARLVAAGPRVVLGALDVTSADITFDGAYYFHGTRVMDSAEFAGEGI